MSPRHIFEQAEASLKRLQIEQIDILLIQSIDQYGRGPEAVRRVVEGGMVEALTKLKASGKIRCFGVSGQLPELTCAARTGLFDVALAYATCNHATPVLADPGLRVAPGSVPSRPTRRLTWPWPAIACALSLASGCSPAAQHAIGAT